MNNNEDILYQLQELKTNIELVEENKSNKEALNKVYISFTNVYEHIKSFLILKKERYYGYFLMNLKLEIDFYKDITAGVSLNSDPFTLTINPLLLGKYKIKEIIYIICHEIEHIVLDHPSEIIRINNSLNPNETQKLNIAMDTSINDRLNYEITTHSNIISTPPTVIDSNVFKKMYKLKSVQSMQDYLYYYRLIPKDNNKNNKNNKTSKENTQDNNDNQNNNGNNNNTIYNNGDKSNDIVTSKDSNGGKCHNWIESDIAEDVKERIKEFVKKVSDGIPEESRGLFPAYQQEALKKILAPPEIKWETVLKKYIGLIPIPYKKTKMRLNRRQPERFDIPGRINDRTIRIITAIDTSGSMSNEMLEKVFVEIFSILKNSKFELTIIECDAEIGRIYQARTMKDIKLKVTGRGGTCFTPVIDHINKTGKYRDAVLIYFTDGYGEEEIPKPKTYRNLWVIIGNKQYFSVEQPYGEVLEIGKEYYDNQYY